MEEIGRCLMEEVFRHTGELTSRWFYAGKSGFDSEPVRLKFLRQLIGLEMIYGKHEKPSQINGLNLPPTSPVLDTNDGKTKSKNKKNLKSKIRNVNYCKLE